MRIFYEIIMILVRKRGDRFLVEFRGREPMGGGSPETDVPN
jgi:hypothetical protein